MEQVAVSIVDLNGIEAGLECALDGVVESFLQILDILQRHLSRLGVVLVPWDGGGSVHIIWPAVEILASNGTGAEPRGDSAGFATGVAELNHDVLVLRVREVDNFLQILDLGVLPESDVFRGDAAVGRDSGGFDAGKAWAALNDAAHLVDQVRDTDA